MVMDARGCICLHLELHVGAFGCSWLHLATPGRSWSHLDAFECFWLLVTSFGLSWLVLAACGCFWLIWLRLVASLLGLSLESVWGRKTLIGVSIWNDLSLAATLLELSLSSVWERTTLIEDIFGMM